ncbi:MAG TPA: serine hydrolase [Caulobacteraceae bacterium]|nr:serine hydrolase [Caulobacteraceae bacterium]
MTFSRRAALALAASAALAACQRKLTTPPKAGPMDTKRLDAEFPALAERARPGSFALGVMNLATTATWYWNTDRAFPLAGTVALPIATAALAQVDARKLALAQRVAFDALDLSPPPSLIDHAWPTPPDKHAGGLPLQDLITLALRESDDTAIDVLMKQVGGPGAVSAFLQQKGVTGLRVDRYEREIGVELLGMPTFRPDWKDPAAFSLARDQVTARERQTAMNRFILDPRDTSTVPAALGFLGLLASGQLISAVSLGILLRWMQDAPPGRFAPGLPRGVTVARATGETATDLGFTAATAELAIATFPGGRRYALAGFLVGSTGTWKARNALFSDAAQLVAAAIG